MPGAGMPQDGAPRGFPLFPLDPPCGKISLISPQGLEGEPPPTPMPIVPRSTNPDKYPVEFFDLLRRASAGEVLRIPPEPGSGPAGLRGYLQAFLRACESLPEHADAAKQISVTIELFEGQQVVRVAHRSKGKYAQLVRAALGGTSVDEKALSAEQALMANLPI